MVSRERAQTATPWATGTYVYDGAGNIQSIGAEQYRYDALGRLRSGTIATGQTQAVTYDPYGNITTMTTAGTTLTVGVSAATNRLTSSGSNVYGSYDNAGRLTSAMNGAGGTFSYDALDSVMTSTVNGVTKVYWYTASDELIAGCQTYHPDIKEAAADECPLIIHVSGSMTNAGTVGVEHQPDELQIIEIYGDDFDAFEVLRVMRTTITLPKRGTARARKPLSFSSYRLASGIPTTAWHGVRSRVEKGVYEVPPGEYQLVVRYRGNAARGRVCFAATEPFVLQEKSLWVGGD